jgi:acetyltransferase-like isoleucine patch superfamily enzyme
VAPHPLGARLRNALALEFSQLRPQLVLLSLLALPIPRGSGGALRAALLRLVGFTVGAGTRVQGLPSISGGAERLSPNLVLGAACEVSWGCVLEIGEKLTLGDGVRLGVEVLILTTTHELGPKESRAGPLQRKPVTVGSGASLGARSIVLPGVTIGEGAQILAGSVVNKDVPARTRWGGIPAKLLGPVEP